MRVLAAVSLVFQLSLISGWLPQTASAQAEPTRPTEDAEYRSVIAEALQEFNRGNWEEAAALFERAHRLNPSARTSRGMGLTAYEARRYVDAIQHLTEALGDTRRPLTEVQREDVGATLERARRFVAHLRIKVEPATARVTINGRPAELDSKGDVAIDPGMPDVEVTADGYEPELRRVRLTAGGHEELNLQLRPTRAEATAATAPPVVDPNGTQAPFAATQPTRDEAASPIRVLKWVAGGAALAAFATGGILLAMQRSKAADFEASCNADNASEPRCNSLRSDVTGGFWNGAIIGFSIGGGLAAVATVLFVVDATDDAGEPTARNGCGLGPGDIGVQCGVAF